MPEPIEEAYELTNAPLKKEKKVGTKRPASDNGGEGNKKYSNICSFKKRKRDMKPRIFVKCTIKETLGSFNVSSKLYDLMEELFTSNINNITLPTTAYDLPEKRVNVNTACIKNLVSKNHDQYAQIISFIATGCLIQASQIAANAGRKTVNEPDLRTAVNACFYWLNLPR